MNTPRRYRVPAREVEAICVATGEANLEAIKAFCPEVILDFYSRIAVGPHPPTAKIANFGDWIVKDADGTFSVWTRDDFIERFEEVI